MDSNTKGAVTELRVLSELVKYGVVSIPYGNRALYDCIWELNGKFVRVQIKASRPLDDNRFKMNAYTCSVNTKETKYRRYTKDDIDVYATVYDGVVYIIPVEEVGAEIRLSFNQTMKTQRLASNYTIEKYIAQVVQQ